ncbi:hypothetical protein ACFRCG_28430 [Embleya sp. NPDC056575]|uniref:hypothetical protein n=1 Tax=unclassified Embleya TaxID=2699296 RepID=UPI0036B45679
MVQLMRVQASYGEDGSIIALAEIIEAGDDRVRVRLRPSEDRKIAELEVPPEYADRPFADLAARFKVTESPDGAAFTPNAS